MEPSLEIVRKASVRFIRSAGPDAQHYLNEPDTFAAYLASYQEAVGAEIAWLAYNFTLPVPDSLAAVLPTPGLELATDPLAGLLRQS